METSAKTGKNIDVLFSTLFETANLPSEMSLEVTIGAVQQCRSTTVPKIILNTVFTRVEQAN